MTTLQPMPEPAEEHGARPVVGAPSEAIADALPQAPSGEPVPPRSRRAKRILTIGAIGLALCILAYWQIRSMRGLFNSALPYAPTVFPSLIALGTIVFKDWKNYRPHWVRWMLIFFVLAAGCVGVRYQHGQREEKAEVARVSQQNIDGLKGQVTAAQQAQTENTKIFTKSFFELSAELNDLKTKVTTKELQDKIVSLQSRLDKTIDPPRAKLIFSFEPLKVIKIDDTHTIGEAVTEKTLSLAADGSFHVEFTILNLTDVDAIDGEMTLQICDTCKFAKEPPEFTKLAGQDERQRHKTFNRIHSQVQFYTLSADIIAPPGSRDVAVGMYFRCNTCVREKGPSRIMVHLAPQPKARSPADPLCEPDLAPWRNYLRPDLPYISMPASASPGSRATRKLTVFLAP